MNPSDALVTSGKLNERFRCKAILDDCILGWSKLIEDAGPDAEVTVSSVIDELLIVREHIENETRCLALG